MSSPEVFPYTAFWEQESSSAPQPFQMGIWRWDTVLGSVVREAKAALIIPAFPTVLVPVSK